MPRRMHNNRLLHLPYSERYCIIGPTCLKRTAIICLLLLWNGSEKRGFAEETIRYTADVSRLPVGTDIAAMGDAGVVLPRRVTATIWNPAAAAFLKRYEFSMEGADLYQHLSQQGCFSGTAPLRNNLGTALCYLPFYSGRILMYDTIPEASGFNGIQRHQSVGFIRNYQHLVVCAFARNFPLQLPRFSGTALPLPLDLSIGGNMKAYAQTMSPRGVLHIGMGYNADIGLQARFGLDFDIKTNKVSRELWLGAALRDVLPSDVIWISSRDNKMMSSPENYHEAFHYAQYYGIAYVDRSGDLFANWTVALSLQKEYVLTYHGGIEAEFWNMAFFRVGFSGRTPTLGAGLRYRRLFIDYAFRFEEIALSFIRLTIGIELPALQKASMKR